MPVINPNDCGKFEKAIQALASRTDKVLASPICLTPTDDRGARRLPASGSTRSRSSLTFDTTDPGVPPYQEILRAQGQEKLIGDPWTNVGFGEMATLAKFLNKLGPTKITTAGIIKQMKAFRGPMVLGSPNIQCGKYPKAPGVCNDNTQFYRYVGAERRRLHAEGGRLGAAAEGLGRPVT